MAIIFSQDIIEVAIKARYAGRPVVNVIHMFNDESGGSDQSKVEDLRDNWQDHILPPLNAEYVLDVFEWRSLDPDDANAGTVAPDPGKPTVGGAISQGMPPNVSYLIHKVTINRPRGKKDGRIYLPGVGEPATEEDGALLPSQLTAWAAILDDFLAGVNDTDFAVGSGSYMAVLEIPPEARVAGTQPVNVDHRGVGQLVMDARLATQRGRLR